jgi:hypothetical protein
MAGLDRGIAPPHTGLIFPQFPFMMQGHANPPRGTAATHLMKYLLALLLIALVVWNAYRIPRGEAYLYPKEDESLRYSVVVSGPGGEKVEGSLTLHNEGVTEIGDKEYQEFHFSFDGKPGLKNKSTYSRWTSDGIYSRNSEKAHESEHLELPLPPKVGHKWRYQVDGEWFDAEIAAIESVTVGDKVHRDCVKVVAKGLVNGIPGQITSYYAPRSGMVKSTMNAAGMTLEFTQKNQ